MAEITDLARFRADAAGVAPPVSEAGAREIKVSWRGRLLAVDQTCSNVGWVFLDSRGGVVTVEETGMVKTQERVPMLKGNADLLSRGSEVFTALGAVLARLKPHRVVHEAPGVGGGLRNPESSLVASMALRCACVGADIPVSMVANQPVKFWATGIRGATKPQIKQAMLRLLPAVADHKPLNEHVYDALAVGLYEIEKRTS